jgi:predicted ArsR family transcriptional regulator
MRPQRTENHSRQRILTLLRMHDRMTVGELSREIGITTMAVRQHLLHLEGEGEVNHEIERLGVGRPVHVYALTEKANHAFPDAYESFSTDILDAVSTLYGRARVGKLLEARNQKIVREHAAALYGIKSIPHRIAAFARSLDAQGCMVRLERKKGRMVLRQFNCLMPATTGKYPEICAMELHLYRSLFGPRTERTRCRRDGASSCDYVFPTSREA